MGLFDKAREKLHRPKLPPPVPPKLKPPPSIPPRLQTEDPLLKPISNDAPGFHPTSDHPVKLPQMTTESPVQTNSFYGNLLVEDQNLPVWTHPYVVWFNRKDTYGLAVSHSTNEQKAYGPDPNANPVQFYFSPAGIQSIVFSAAEFDPHTSIQLNKMTKFACNLSLCAANGGSINFSLVQGMGFVSGVYQRLLPVLNSSVGFAQFTVCGSIQQDVAKYAAHLFNGSTWLIYVRGNVSLSLQNPSTIVGSNVADCTIQVCTGDFAAYDQAAGSRIVDCHLSTEVVQDSVSYKFNYKCEGTSPSGHPFIWALPHHVESLENRSILTSHQLDSTVCGKMTGVVSSVLGMRENPCPVGFEFMGAAVHDPALLMHVVRQEMQQDVVSISDTDSMYTSGKILDKYAFLLYTATFIVKDIDSAKQYCGKLSLAMDRFASNQQREPLLFDTKWKGIVSQSGMDGNFFKDFGNTFYNDHHFHYGYHIHAAALLVKCEQYLFGKCCFLDRNRKWVETLIRDVCNPVEDAWLPQFRCFDWFNGHSWAKGTFPSGDGKDEESTSEDYHCYYGIKLWGVVTENKSLETLASTILAVMRRSFQTYFLLKDDNTTQPNKFIKNKVTGILFENKVDHATYFGANLEYIQGIHMLPLTPVSSYFRTAEYVREEWQQLLERHVESVDDGWKGILMLNLALWDPQRAYSFFASDSFQEKWLDNGMCRSWCLAFCGQKQTDEHCEH